MPHASTAYICLHRGSRDTGTGHTRDTGAHGHTDARITQTKLTTIPTHQRYTNAPTRTTTETANRAAALIQDKPPCWCPKFRCSDKLAASKGCAQGDASERRIERSSRAKTRQKALMALYGFRSTSGKRSSEFQGIIRAELNVPEPLELTA